MKFGQHCQNLDKLLCGSALWRRNSTHKIQLLITGYKTQESMSGVFHLLPDTQIILESQWHNEDSKSLISPSHRNVLFGINEQVKSRKSRVKAPNGFSFHCLWHLGLWELKQTPKCCSKIFYYSSNWEKGMCPECL